MRRLLLLFSLVGLAACSPPGGVLLDPVVVRGNWLPPSSMRAVVRVDRPEIFEGAAVTREGVASSLQVRFFGEMGQKIYLSLGYDSSRRALQTDPDTLLQGYPVWFGYQNPSFDVLIEVSASRTVSATALGLPVYSLLETLDGSLALSQFAGAPLEPLAFGAQSRQVQGFSSQYDPWSSHLRSYRDLDPSTAPWTEPEVDPEVRDLFRHHPSILEVASSRGRGLAAVYGRADRGRGPVAVVWPTVSAGRRGSLELVRFSLKPDMPDVHLLMLGLTDGVSVALDGGPPHRDELDSPVFRYVASAGTYSAFATDRLGWMAAKGLLSDQSRAVVLTGGPRVTSARPERAEWWPRRVSVEVPEGWVATSPIGARCGTVLLTLARKVFDPCQGFSGSGWASFADVATGGKSVLMVWIAGDSEGLSSEVLPTDARTLSAWLPAELAHFDRTGEMKRDSGGAFEFALRTDSVDQAVGVDVVLVRRERWWIGVAEIYPGEPSAASSAHVRGVARTVRVTR